MADDVHPRAYSPTSFCEAFDIGLTLFYELQKTGALKTVKLGRRTLVPADAAEAWLAALEPKAV